MISGKTVDRSGHQPVTTVGTVLSVPTLCLVSAVVLALSTPGVAQERVTPFAPAPIDLTGRVTLTPPAGDRPEELSDDMAGEMAEDFSETVPREPFVGDIVGETFDQYTWSSDTLLDLARADNLGLIELMAANPGIDPWVPGKASHLMMPTAHIVPDAPRDGVIINLADLRLYYFDKEGHLETFPIGVGREGFTTPLGRTKIVRKKDGPSWYPTANARAEDPELPAVIGPGPDNPLGEFALYLGWPTYLVHGTSKPWGVGRRVSRGCIRLYPEDIAWLYENLPVGTPVTVVDQPIKMGRKNGELYLEVHPTPDQQNEIERNGYAISVLPPDMTDDILAAAGDDYARIDWDRVDKALIERRGMPIQITKPITETLSIPGIPDYAAR